MLYAVYFIPGWGCGVKAAVLLTSLACASGFAAESSVPRNVETLRAPICVDHPQAQVCRLPLKEVQRREQEIIDRDWRKVHAVLPELQHAQPASMPWDYAPEATYKQYCEALRQDLLNGNYKVFRKPDVASEEVGIGRFVEVLDAARSDCVKPDRHDSQSFLKGQGYSDGGIWLHKLRDGFAILSFSLSTVKGVSNGSTLFFDYTFEDCKKSGGLPEFPRIGFGRGEDRTETLAITVLERGERELVGLEYGVIHGFGDERAYRYGPYGESLEPKVVWTEAPLAPASTPSKNARQKGPWTPRFIAAFVAPPPWRQYASQPSEYDERGESRQPCIWKLPE